MQSVQRVAPLWVGSSAEATVGTIINLQALLVKSNLLNAVSITEKPFPLETTARRSCVPAACLLGYCMPIWGPHGMPFDTINSREVSE